MKVFCVDDEQAILEWLVKSVEWEAYNCEVVGYSTRAVDALSYLETEAVDLLITDISMPEMSGLELIRAVKKKYPDMLVIIISAYSEFQYVKEALKYGIINYLLKPIDISELYECLKVAGLVGDRKINNYHNGDIMTFRNSVLHELVEGGFDENRLEERCKFAGLPVKNQIFRVVVADTREKDNSVCLAIVNHFHTEEFAGYYCFWDSRMNLVILILGDRESVEEIEKRILKVFRREGCSDLFICIGMRLTGYGQIAESYRACCDFLNAGFLFVRRIVKLVEYPYEKYLTVLKTEFLQMISNAILSDNVEAVIRNIQKQVERSRTEEEKKKELICLAVLLIKNIKLNHSSWDILMPEKKLENQESSGKMLEWIASFYTGIVNAEKGKKKGMYSCVSYVMEEVAVHYGDKELCLQKMSDLCGVTTAYLGKLFRIETGEYFNDYLLRRRLTAAEELLMNTRFNMCEIASAVGFSSQSYFNRVFRKIYKMSPMEYRNHLRNMEQ